MVSFASDTWTKSVISYFVSNTKRSFKYTTVNVSFFGLWFFCIGLDLIP